MTRGIAMEPSHRGTFGVGEGLARAHGSRVFPGIQANIILRTVPFGPPWSDRLGLTVHRYPASGNCGSGESGVNVIVRLSYDPTQYGFPNSPNEPQMKRYLFPKGTR